MNRVLGFEVCPLPELSPRLERETFAGGWNDSARARNVWRVRDARKYWIDRVHRRIICAPFMADMIVEALLREAESLRNPTLRNMLVTPLGVHVVTKP